MTSLKEYEAPNVATCKEIHYKPQTMSSKRYHFIMGQQGSSHNCFNLMSFVILRKTATNWTDLIESGINEFPTEEQANNALEELREDGDYKIVPTDELDNYDLIA